VLVHLRIRRIAGGTLLGAGVLGTSVTGLLCAAHPAAAAAALAAVQSAVTCTTTGLTACVSATNTSSGIGILGTSNTGSGMRGTSTFNNGVQGQSNTGLGVLGQSTSGFAGVAGTSPSTGVIGFGSVGVYGLVPGAGYGIFGNAPAGSGVRADGNSGIALRAASKNSGTAVDVFSESGNGLLAKGFGAAGGVGVVALGGNVSLKGTAPVDGFPLRLTNANGNVVFSVDGAGNVLYAGAFSSTARTLSGATVTAFNSKTTLPVVEDSGTAQLVAGTAAVPLDPNFASTIDAKTGYRVFLTPGGDTHGLFVAATTPSGFVVRESRGGRATVSFDYRIVATALGQSGQRMAVTTGMPRVSLPLVRQIQPLRHAAPATLQSASH
jgi:hypothetical protein